MCDVKTEQREASTRSQISGRKVERAEGAYGRWTPVSAALAHWLMVSILVHLRGLAKGPPGLGVSLLPISNSKQQLSEEDRDDRSISESGVTRTSN